MLPLARALLPAFTAILLLALSAISAHAAGPGWISDPKTGCKIWNAKPQAGETVTWKGPCRNGMANGKGVLQWFENGKPGDRYEGSFLDGNKNGFGVETFANGAVFRGTWKSGLANGQGDLATPDGAHFAGKWMYGCLIMKDDNWVTLGVSKDQCGFE